MTAEPVTIYAVGGGRGHAVRGALIQESLWTCAGVRALLLVRAGALPPGVELAGPTVETATGEVAPAILARGGTLVADTFPDGWRDRFPRALQERHFAQRLLVARAVNGGRAPLPGTQDFDAIGSPYSEEGDEWRVPLPNGRCLGFLLRRKAWEYWPRTRRFLIVDPDRRCGPPALRALAKAARAAGFRHSYTTRFSNRLSAAKILFVGAGYHTFYEALREGADARFVAVPKRYDDQAARAERYGVRVADLQEILAWLLRPAEPPRQMPQDLNIDHSPAVAAFVLETEA